MPGKHLHIVCFDVPYPVSHGGFYDVFYKIKALHHHGYAIYLHCFEYGRGEQQVLNTFCKAVYYYPRKRVLKSFSLSLPYIVASRKNDTLIKNLSADNHPILLEGTHCTYLLYQNLFPGRTVLYRLFNIEHIYYKHLFYAERHPIKKLYYLWESYLLKQYEKKVLQKATKVFTIACPDVTYVKDFCPSATVEYLAAFLPYSQVASKAGTGKYCLYHGNLSVAENEKAAIWLMENVFNTATAFPLIIAGRQPAKRLLSKIKENKNIQLIADPTEAEMQELIQEAQVNLIISFNATGIKLKLINALFNGRHCVANHAAVKGTGLEACCYNADSAIEIKNALSQLNDQAFTIEDISKREMILLPHFDVAKMVQQLNQMLP